MQGKHVKYNPPALGADLEARLEAEARQCAEEDFQLGMLFQDMQEEAYTSWEAWDADRGLE